MSGSRVARLVCIVVIGCGSFAPAAAATTGTMVITESTRLTEDHHGEIVIGASGITLDCATHRVVGPGAFGIRLGLVAGVTVENCIVSGFTFGILVGSSEHNLIRDNRAEANHRYGFLLFSAHGNSLSGNQAVDNGFGTPLLGGGFAVARSSGNSLSDNVAMLNRDDGFRLGDGSSENRLTENAAIGNTFSGFSVFGAHRNVFAHNRSSDNASTGLLLTGSSENVISENHTSDNGFAGIDVRAGSHANRVQDNRAAENTVTGILVLDSDANLISSNSTARNGFAGIDVRGRSAGTVIEWNHASDNLLYGILVTGGTSATTVAHNVTHRNAADGIRVDDSSTAVIENSSYRNDLLGIRAVPGVTDGGGNRAKRSGDARECVGVACP